MATVTTSRYLSKFKRKPLSESPIADVHICLQIIRKLPVMLPPTLPPITRPPVKSAANINKRKLSDVDTTLLGNESARKRSAGSGSENDNASLKGRNPAIAYLDAADDMVAAFIEPPVLSKDRYRDMAALNREEARRIKHLGDARARNGNMSTAQTQMSILEHVDGCLMFIYGFDCEDLAIGTYHGDILKRGCGRESWLSTLKLIEFVRDRCNKIGWTELAAMLNMIDAFILHRCVAQQQHMIKSQVQKKFGPPQNGKARSDPSPTPSDQVSPASDAGAMDADAFYGLVNQMNQDSMHAASLLSRGEAVFMSPDLAFNFPKLRKLLHPAHDTIKYDANVVVSRPWQFSWPLPLYGENTVVHSILMCKALMDEIAEINKLDFRSSEAKM